MYFLSKSYQIVLDRYVDTPGHGKYVMDGFNAVQKQYLATVKTYSAIGGDRQC